MTTQQPPICSVCKRPSRKATGAEIYPHRSDLHSKTFWKCDGCAGYVGCHGQTDRPLGTPANAELRKARMLLHERMIDPLWKNVDRSRSGAPKDGHARLTIRKTARSQVYAFLAAKLGIAREATHTGMFDLETCRRAWTALNGVTYSEIHEWSKRQQEAA